MVQWPWHSRKKPASNNEPSPASNLTLSLPPSRKTFPSGMKLLYDGGNSAVDIIFVHGLTGDREKTWKTKSATAPWPQTLLPSKVPNARILTYGYDTYVTDWQGMVSKNRLGNHSMNLLAAVATYRDDDGTDNRPIIFVCHSLGGLVCEDALLTAQQRPERHLRNVLHCTCGIVLLGTPHHGSGLAHCAESLAKTIGVLKQTNAEILAVLKSDSEVLERVQNGFHTMIQSRGQSGLTPIEITCFFEELPLPGIGTIVPFRSAVLPGYIPIGIRSNHLDMTKFEDIDDPGFVAVAGELRRWIKESPLIASQISYDNPYEYTTPFIVCINECGKPFEDCLSRSAIDSLADGGYDGLSGSRSLGSRLIDGIPTQRFEPLPAPNYEAKPRLYIYCAPCHLVLDQALSICGHIIYFNGVIRVDYRLCAPSEPLKTVFQKMSTLRRALSTYEDEWRVDNNFKHSWMSSFFDVSWLQQREYDMALELEASPTESAPTFGLDKLFGLHKDDAKCAAIVVMTGCLCSKKLLTPPMVSPPARESRNGEIFRLTKVTGLSNGQRTNWNATFFGMVSPNPF